MENIVDYKVKVGFGGRVKVVLSFASESPALLGAEACDKNDVVKDVPEAKSGSEASLDESILKKDPAAEKDPAADAVDSDKAKAMFSAHAPSQPADFWSKLKRPAAGAIKGALKKDIPAAKSGAEASFDETGGTKNDPALKPVTEDAPAFKPVTAGGAPLPPIKEFSAEGDADWTVSAAKEFPAEEPAPAGIADWTAPSNPRRNNGRKGEVKSTTVSNKYDLLDDVETNLAAENGEDEDEKKSKKKGKEMGAESGKESAARRPPPECVGGTGKAPRGSTPSTTHSGATVETTTTATPEGSVSASGWLSWPKLCWHNALCAVFICLIAVSAGGGAFVYFSHGSDSLLPSIVPDATALPTERGPLFAPFNPTPDPVVPDPPVVNDPAWLIATSGLVASPSLGVGWDYSIECPDMNRKMNVDGCDGSKPFSCTPWDFMVYPNDAANGPNTGAYNVPYDCVGNEDYVGDSSDVGIYKADGADNYFVFHTCDGAGVQTDCIGNTYFVEQLGPLNDPGDKQGFNGNEAPGNGKGNSCNLEDTDLHPYGTEQIGCNFQHPGTNMNYDWYWCGWMSTSGWADQNFEWWDTIVKGDELSVDNLGKDIPGVQQALGGEPDATLTLYPWVCNKDNSGNRNLEPFTGDSTHNCFCDNNAGDQLGGTVPPPNLKFFALRSDGQGQVWMTRVCEYSKGDKVMCNAADDGNENWGQSIELDSFGDQAW